MSLAMVLCMGLFPMTAFAGIGIGDGNNRTVYIGQDIGSISVQTDNGHLITVDSVSLPNGLLFDNQGPQAFIRGTPVAGTTGIYTSTFTDPDDNASNTLTLTVAQGPQTIVQPDIIKAVGDAGFQLTPHSTNGNGTTITGTDTPVYTFGGGNASVATIDASGNVTIVGAGTTTFTIDSAANASYQAATQKVVNITVNAAYALTVAANPAAGGSVSNTGGMYALGSRVSVTATANAGYSFTGWSISGTTFSGGATTSTANPVNVDMSAGAVTLTANFVLNSSIPQTGDGNMAAWAGMTLLFMLGGIFAFTGLLRLRRKRCSLIG